MARDSFWLLFIVDRLLPLFLGCLHYLDTRFGASETESFHVPQFRRSFIGSRLLLLRDSFSPASPRDWYQKPAIASQILVRCNLFNILCVESSLPFDRSTG